MRIKMILSIAAAALALGMLALSLQEAGYLVMLLLFLAASAFSYNAVMLYGRLYPTRRQHSVKVWLWVTFAIYLAFLFLLTFGVRRNFPRFILFDREQLDIYLKHRTNFVPFKTIIGIMRGSDTLSYIIVNIIGNIAATAPLGFFLPMLIRPARKIQLFLIITCLIVIFIEFTQMSFNVGSCDIDDLILNVAGSLIVFLVMRIPAVRKVLPRDQ